MVMAHLGVAFFIIGVTGVRGFESEQDLRMTVGSSAQLGGYDFELRALNPLQGPNYQAMQGQFIVKQNGQAIAMMAPEKRLYDSSQMPMTEAAISVGLTRDLYISLGEQLNERDWSVRIHIKPFVDWIWGGCFVMALGGLLAITDRRYRKRP